MRPPLPRPRPRRRPQPLLLAPRAAAPCTDGTRGGRNGGRALPPGCAATPIGGVEYYNCAPGVYYRAAFQGNNLVYVAAQP